MIRNTQHNTAATTLGTESTAGNEGGRSFGKRLAATGISAGLLATSAGCVSHGGQESSQSAASTRPEAVTAAPFTPSADALSERFSIDDTYVIGVAPDEGDPELTPLEAARRAEIKLDKEIAQHKAESAWREAAEKRREEAVAYAESPERNEKLGDLVTLAGTVVVDEAERTGNIRDTGFNFYNFDTGEWLSKNPNTSGRGALQLNVRNQPHFSADVALVNGQVDRSARIEAVRVGLVDGRSVRVEMVRGTGEDDEPQFEVVLNRPDQEFDPVNDMSSASSVSDRKVDDLRGVDDTAVEILEEYIRDQG